MKKRIQKYEPELGVGISIKTSDDEQVWIYEIIVW